VAAPDVQEREACLTALTAAATPACAADVLRDVARKSAGATVASLRAVTAAAGIHATRQGVVAPLDTGFESGLETLRVRVEVVWRVLALPALWVNTRCAGWLAVL